MLEFQTFGRVDSGNGHAAQIRADAQCLQHGQSGLRVVGKCGILPSAIPAHAISQMLLGQCLAQDFLLRVDSGENRAIAGRLPRIHQFADARRHTLRFLPIAAIYGFHDPPSFAPFRAELQIIGPLRRCRKHTIGIVDDLRRGTVVVVQIDVSGERTEFRIEVEQTVATCACERVDGLRRIAHHANIAV